MRNCSSVTMLTFIQQNLQKQERAVKSKHQRHRIENAEDDRPTVEVLIFPAVLRIARFDETGFDPEGEVAHDEVRHDADQNADILAKTAWT